jgi:CBS domain-containing protein
VDFELSLHSETIEAAYPSDPLAVTPDTLIRDVLLLMKAEKSSSVVVCDAGAIAGIFTERDALKILAAGDSLDAPIASVMSPQVVSIHADATVGDAIQIMSDKGYRRLAIVDETGKPVGLAGAQGIVHYLVDHFPESIYNLPPRPTAGQAEREGA